VTRCFWRDHDHVKVGARYNLVVVDSEAVGESQCGSLLDVRLDFVLVQRRLEFVRGQNHDQICSGNSAGNVSHFQAVSLSLGDSGRTFAQTNSNVNAGVFQVAGLGVTLGAVTDNGYFFALDDRKVAVFVVINFHDFPLYPGHSGQLAFVSFRC